eukprot:m.688 g.688  ORF g.688 m.688 type:complete len:56 (+) comp4416_c0_seq1:72-239(+)
MNDTWHMGSVLINELGSPPYDATVTENGPGVYCLRMREISMETGFETVIISFLFF